MLEVLSCCRVSPFTLRWMGRSSRLWRVGFFVDFWVDRGAYGMKGPTGAKVSNPLLRDHGRPFVLAWD